MNALLIAAGALPPENPLGIAPPPPVDGPFNDEYMDEAFDEITTHGREDASEQIYI